MTGASGSAPLAPDRDRGGGGRSTPRGATGLLLAGHAALVIASVLAFLWIIDRPPPGFVDPGLWSRAYDLGLRWTGAAYIALGFGAAVLAWRRAAPGRRGLVAVAAVLLLSAAVEYVGTTTGLPFGPYRYGPWLGPRIGGHVPVAIPASWFLMLHACLGLAARITSRYGPQVVLAAIGLVAWDVLMDPAMSAAFPFWEWGVEGAFYGMPLLNWGGWAATGLLLAGVALSVGRPTATTLAADPTPPLLYALNGLLPLALTLKAGLWGAALLGGGAMATFLALPWLTGGPAAERLAERMHRLWMAVRIDPRTRRLAFSLPPLTWVVRRRARRLFDLSCGFVYSQVVAALLELELPQAIGTGSLTARELAGVCRLDAGRLRPLLRSAVALGLLRERAGRYRLGPLGVPLLEDPSLRDMLAHNRLLYRDLTRPVELFRAGRGDRVAELWTYAERNAEGSRRDPADETDPEAYSGLMSRTHGLVTRDALARYPFGRHRRILDVGGGEGGFLAEVARRYPGPELILYELPAVAERARAAIRDRGLDGRIEVRAGNFLDDPLPGPVDLVTLVRVVHDHDDAGALRLLAAVREALGPRGRVLVAEPLADPTTAGRAVCAYFTVFFAAMGQGRPRSPDELARLMTTAGLRRPRRLPTSVPVQGGMMTARR